MPRWATTHCACRGLGRAGSRPRSRGPTRGLPRVRRPRTGPFAQIKTWNLSSILRVPTARGAVWCKSVPPFQDHEGTVLAIVGADDPSLVPTVLAADRATGTVLLEDVSGEDQWEASAPVLHEMERRWVRTQARWVDRTDRLPEARIPDWRADAFRGSVAAMLERPEVRSSVEASVVVALDGLVADLPRRLSDLDACGVPETIVHGDFHAGNRRSDGTSLVLLDWGDAGLGHPMLDLTTFLLRVPEKERGSEGWGFDSVPAR
jgi:hypothetical protein